MWDLFHLLRVSLMAYEWSAPHDVVSLPINVINELTEGQNDSFARKDGLRVAFNLL